MNTAITFHYHTFTSLFSPFLYTSNVRNAPALVIREHALTNPDQSPRRVFQYRAYAGRLSSSWIGCGVEGSDL
ncbi:hypothetical protein EYC84_000294 [Monilinia fructicola]|uniref:Uncharacterized protein n=1 Tax=Monilinia fructicola TaxID=38448 RepID=A0A5M9JNR9_MONFR|nr:hypothetical protein EYC84_000294 [Monilinia fructicola]